VVTAVIYDFIDFQTYCVRLRLKCDGTRAETRFRLSAKRTNPFISAGASVQSTTGSRGVRIGGSNDGYTMFRSSVRVLATHSICQFPFHFYSHASPCAITFQLDSTSRLGYSCQNLIPTCLCISLQLFNIYVSLKGTRRMHKSCAEHQNPILRRVIIQAHLSTTSIVLLDIFISAHKSNELIAMTHSTLSCHSLTRQCVAECCDMA
jgi:hypothetical protein